jgi:hypothetical protein
MYTTDNPARLPDSDFGSAKKPEIMLPVSPESLLIWTFLPKQTQLAVMAFWHACPRPNEVARNYGIDWTIQRYKECNEFTQILWNQARSNDKLHQALTTPKQRLHDEPVGLFESGHVPSNHQNVISPLSGLSGYSPARVALEVRGRETSKTNRPSHKGHQRALEMVRASIGETEDVPVFLAMLANRAAVDDTYMVSELAVLDHILPAGIFEEQNNKTEFRGVADALQEFAPTVWKAYASLLMSERQGLGLIQRIP